MNEVEKMYRNAEISCKPNYVYNKVPILSGLEYPPFTAEKQLEIVKQILFSTWWMNLKRLQFSEKFDEGLAQMISDLWQDLTEEKRKQIKEILE